MSAIYGWLSNRPTAGQDELVDLQKKTSKTFAIGMGSVNRSHENIAALGGFGRYGEPSIYQTPHLLIIIDGTPQWQDSSLAKVAEGQGAAQALAEGYRRDGRAILSRLSGPFALCLLEPDRPYALLAVDRMGIRPLAYYIKNGLLVFGSHLEQILAHPDVKADIDPQGLFNYLYFQMVPSPGTIYKDVIKLQPGEFLEISNGQAQQGFYWQRRYVDSSLPKQKLLEQLHVELDAATAVCHPDGQTGAFLSGGLDSSTVTGVFQKMAGKPIDAFTIGFDAEGYDEMEYARITAKHFQVNLHEYYVTPADVLKAIPLISETYDEPFGNASAIPAYYCAKFAREHGMARLLAGDGGDEIFAGNARYAKQKMFDIYGRLPDVLKLALKPLALDLPVLSKLKSYVQQARIPMPERLETYNFLHRTPLADIFAGDFLNQINSELPLQYLKETYQRGPEGDLVKQMLFLDNKFTLADNDLRKVNRMCELAGIDVQYPMLQENLVAFAASVPSKWLMEGFELRSFYRQAMVGFLAKETLAKSKQGFGLPFGVWLATDDQLKQFAEANLQGIEKRGFLNPDYIKKLIQLHQAGNASYYGVMIWLLVVLEQWLSTH